MNLRNKKTGKLYEWCSIMVKKNRKSVKLIVAEKEDCKFTVEDDGETYYYKSFEQMCEEWETVEDPRPEYLIDDKNIRYRLRKWMEAIDISLDTHLTGVQSGAYGLIIECGDNRIVFRYYKKLLHRNRRKTGFVTMRELIGEKE